jgi:predicted nuclease with TOPRIM domain
MSRPTENIHDADKLNDWWNENIACKSNLNAQDTADALMGLLQVVNKHRLKVEHLITIMANDKVKLEEEIAKLEGLLGNRLDEMDERLDGIDETLERASDRTLKDLWRRNLQIDPEV